MEAQNQKSWFSQNWIWVVPVGGCLTLIILGIFGLGAAFFGISEVVKSSEPYEFAIEESMHNAELVSILGEPIETDGMMQGTINFKNKSGNVDISVPLRGPNGEATIFIKGEKEDGTWTYEEFYVVIKETSEKINLLDKDLEGI
jgi:hypothetical protein